MGLIERKILARIKEATAQTESDINSGYNTNFKLTVDESSFPMDEKVLEDFFMHRVYGLDSIAQAIAILADDEMSIEALREQVKTITIVNTASSFSDPGSKSVSLDDSNLSIRCAFSEGSDNLFRPDKLVRAIEEVLN